MLRGIDVSGYQANTIFKQQNPDFAMIKATEGVGYVSDGLKRLYTAWKEYKPDDGLTGFYHYARPETGNTAVSEAESFMNAIEPYKTNALVALDWEGDALGVDPEWAYQWLYTVANRMGTIPLIYMSASVTRTGKWSKVAGLARLWVAQYGVDKPNYEGWENWSMWQFTSTPCDQDYFPADRKAWLNLANGRDGTPAPAKTWQITSQTDSKIILEKK